MIDGQFYDPSSRLEELEEWAEEDETTDTDAEADSMDAGDTSDGTGGDGDEVGSSRAGGGEEEEEEEEEEDAYVSAANSPQVSAPSSPREGGGGGGVGVGALDLSSLSGGSKGETASVGPAIARGERAGGSPRKTPRDKGKKWQSVKTTLVEVSPQASPNASPGASPSGSPLHADGNGKHLGGVGPGRGAVVRREEASEDEGDVSEDSDGSTATSRSTSRSSSVNSTTASARTTKPSSPRAMAYSASAEQSSVAAKPGEATNALDEEEEGDVPEISWQSEHGGAEYWGREYSSLTHRSILEGFRALEGAGVQELVKGEALALVFAELSLLVLEQTHWHLPV